jgi:DNA replication and repair protein RecF
LKFLELSLRQFRNIEAQTLILNPGLNVFRGQNGQGKTNLIESLYLLSHGQSFRTSRWDDLIHTKLAQGFYLKALVEKKNTQNTIELKNIKGKKQLRVNGQSMTTPMLARSFPTLLFSPESLLIVKDSPQKRRDLIDDLCLTLFPQFPQLLMEYRKVLRQKNSLLKQAKDEKVDLSQAHKINDSLTEILLDRGSLLTSFRLQAISEIEPFLLNEFLKIMDEHYGTISIKYFISGVEFRTQKQAEIRNALYKRWGELKSREWASGLSLVGPHKHDIQFDFNDQEARFFCSQGQQRAIILAFKMAQTRLHYSAHKEFPILLLDDVLSELDREKQMRFVNYLLSTEAQIFLTTTDATSIPEMAHRSVYEVIEGVFKESDRFFTGGLSV